VVCAIFRAAMVGSVSPSRRSASALADSSGPMPPKSWISRFASGVDARDGQREQIFDQLIIVKTAGTGIEQPLAQPGAMPARIDFVRFRGASVDCRSLQATGPSVLTRPQKPMP